MLSVDRSKSGSDQKRIALTQCNRELLRLKYHHFPTWQTATRLDVAEMAVQDSPITRERQLA